MTFSIALLLGLNRHDRNILDKLSRTILRVGGPLTVLLFLIAMFLVPRTWPLQLVAGVTPLTAAPSTVQRYHAYERLSHPQRSRRRAGE